MRRTLTAFLGPFLGLALVLALFVVYGKIAKPDVPFLSAFRMALIAKQTAIVGMGALGMTVVILSGGIDLAIGSVVALTSVVLALSLQADLAPLAALALTALTGIGAGLVNGLLVTRLRLAPFIITLGTMLSFRGAAEQLSGQTKIPARAPDWLARLLDGAGPGSVAGICAGVLLTALLGGGLAFVLRRTVFGRRVVAVGSNEQAAHLAGVPTDRVKVAVYALGGFFTSLAGVFEFSNLNSQGNPTSGIGLELDVIAAVVIGGGSLNGGRGSVLGSIIGALLMTTLRSGCVFAEIPDPVQKIVIGAIIVGAVTVDHLRQRRRA